MKVKLIQCLLMAGFHGFCVNDLNLYRYNFEARPESSGIPLGRPGRGRLFLLATGEAARGGGMVLAVGGADGERAGADTIEPS
jgi:hypothetical protein